jgi:hypothetical protein
LKGLLLSKIKVQGTVGIQTNHREQVVLEKFIFNALPSISQILTIQRKEDTLVDIIHTASNGVALPKLGAKFLHHATRCMKDACIVPMKAKGLTIPSGHARVHMKGAGGKTHRDAIATTGSGCSD